MKKVTQFNPEEPEILLLKTGIYSVVVTIEDMWGATFVYEVPGNVVVK